MEYLKRVLKAYITINVVVGLILGLVYLGCSFAFLEFLDIPEGFDIMWYVRWMVFWFVVISLGTGIKSGGKTARTPSGL